MEEGQQPTQPTKEERELELLRKQVDTGEKIEQLMLHGVWGFYQDWLNSGLTKLEKTIHDKELRQDQNQWHRIIRALDAADIYRDIISGPEKMAKLGQEARKKLEDRLS